MASERGPDTRSDLEGRLVKRADGMERMGRYQSPLTGLLREAAEVIGKLRRELHEARNQVNSERLRAMIMRSQPEGAESPR